MNICIAENLSLLRQKNGYTLEALAEIISVSRQTVAKWEAGDSHPDIVNCLKLATLFKVSLDELVNKPLKDALNKDFSMEDGRVCGVLKLSEEGTLRIPDTVLDMFEINKGDAMLLLADRREGIALVKCSRF